MNISIDAEKAFDKGTHLTQIAAIYVWQDHN